MPHAKNCQHCQKKFTLSKESQELYQKIQVPEPKHCPDCRRIRRYAFRNERKLYKRKCDLCGDPTASTHRQGTKYKVFCTSCWWSDAWDGLDYGQEVDFRRDFLEQFNELKNKVPHYAVHTDSDSEDCKFINYGIRNKSSYLSVCTFSENTYYSQDAKFSKFCIDCSQINNCKACCECTNCQDCYKLNYSQNCFKCHHSMFLTDCKNCQNCFLCSNQNDKEYMVMNQQLTKEQYEDYLQKIQLNYEMVSACKKSLNELSTPLPKPTSYQMNCDNSTGNYLNNCRNCQDVFNANTNLQDSTNCEACHSASHELHDCSFSGVNSHHCYETLECTISSNLKFSHSCRNCNNSEYCQYCSGNNLFGCMGLKNQEYCILNKKYSPEEYFHLKNRIIEQMKSSGQYGEFFPISSSVYPYNETLAQELNPLSKDEVLKQNWKWEDKVQLETKAADIQINGTIQEAPQDFTDKTLVCQSCQTNYKIINRELGLRQQLQVPFNPNCLECRYTERQNYLQKPFTFAGHCAKCQATISSSYSPDRPEIVYCEQCYLDSTH